MGVCNCSMFCCTLPYVPSSIAIILMGKRELVALLNLSSWCLVMVERLFLAVPRGCLRFVIVVFPDQTHLLSTAYCSHSANSDTKRPFISQELGFGIYICKYSYDKLYKSWIFHVNQISICLDPHQR